MDIQIEVADDSILAHKELQIRSVREMKNKHLRALREIARLGRQIDPAHVDEDLAFELMDKLPAALEGMLIGWSAADIDELTLAEMLAIYNQLNAQTRLALPNATSPSSTRPTARATVARGRPGSAR